MSSHSHSPFRAMLLVALVVGFGGYYVINYTTFGKQLLRNNREAAGDNLAQIAKAYADYRSHNGGAPRMLVAKRNDTAHAVAEILAREMGLNDASLYFVKYDSLAPKTPPQTVLAANPPSGKLDPDFARATLSIIIAANIPLNAPPATTPIAWTRELDDDGSWELDSPFQGNGGHIAFLDGHVEWGDKLPLLKYGTKTATANIREALPPGAIILPAEPGKK